MKKHIDILPNLCYLVSQIISSFSDVSMLEEDIIWLLKIGESLDSYHRQYILMILLSYLYTQPIALQGIVFK